MTRLVLSDADAPVLATYGALCLFAAAFLGGQAVWHVAQRPTKHARRAR